MHLLRLCLPLACSNVEDGRHCFHVKGNIVPHFYLVLFQNTEKLNGDDSPFSFKKRALNFFKK
jgi:hypothetical protein